MPSVSAPLNWTHFGGKSQEGWVMKMPIESMPRTPVAPQSGGIRYQVTDGDDWNSVAKRFGVNVQALIKFSFGTLNTHEVNWYLRRRVGCVVPSPLGWNWKFSSSARPGVIQIPISMAGPIEIQVQMYTYSIATFSWIDPRTNLPEVDEGDPGEIVVRDDILANKGYRFANFLEASVGVMRTSAEPLLYSLGYTKDCGIYRAPSFLGLPSYAYPIKLFDPVYLDQAVEFRQIVGARTQSAELAAGKLGPLGPLGGAIAQKIFPFPPIWTDLRLTIHYDGTYTGDLFAYSLFPSLTYYENSKIPCFVTGSSSGPCQGFEKKFGYDGMPNYKRWFGGSGWGKQKGYSPGEGNPWGVTEPDKGAIYGEPQPDPNEVARRPTTIPPQPWLPPRR
jgi:hypothetical protein